jgi:DNA-binding winged helix-turn-helix (wHTH) protein/tetratricopeptide (TPR) repeat protein
MHSPVPSPTVLRFGVFEADLRSGELRKNGVKVKIQELPYRALRVLLSRPNEVVSRDQLRRALWPEGVFVDFDRGISSAINRLRDALGDSADNPIFIETVERRGYRWIAPTWLPQAPPLQLVVMPEQKPADVSASHTSWRWALVLPVVAILLAAWHFRHGARAANKPSANPSASINSGTPHAANSEAEDFYLKGRYYWNKRTPEDLNKAVDFFTQAIVRDPNYAPAYVGLADTYNLLREYSMMPAQEAYPRAQAAAKRAVELDDHSSAAHASLAFASFYGSWDAATAEREFRRAIELDPKSAVAHHWYATYLSTVRRLPEGLAQIEQAQAIDPASKSILADKGRILFLAGKHDEAIALLKQMEAAEPDFVSPHRYLKFGYVEEEKYPEYIVEMRKEAALLHDNPEFALAAAAEKGYASGGSGAMFGNMREVQKKFVEQGAGSPFVLAEISARLGRNAEALQYLKIAYERHDEQLAGMEYDPAFTNLHADPAYLKLVAQLGF